MMVAMIRRPPERPALRRRCADEGEDKLRPAGSFERPMREISMIDARDGEHPNQIEPERYENCGPTPTDDKDSQASKMKENKG
jgi:hypothetical protein